MRADKLKDPGVRTKQTRQEKEEREEVDTLIRYALQVRSASKTLQEDTNEQEKDNG